VPRKGQTKLTPELSARICAFLRAGNYLETAAVCARISKSQLFEWLRAGGKPHAQEPFRTFAAEVEAAQAEAEARDVARIGEAAEKDWKAAAWRLERRNPNRWSRRVELTGADGGAVKMELESGTLLDLLRRLEGRGSEPEPKTVEGEVVGLGQVFALKDG
jgi:hypothetical protein